jgi:hypothetical protein
VKAAADGIHVQARLEDEAQCLLVIIGATPEGKKELVGLIDGVRESAQSWRELLLDLKRRGLAIAPELAFADGALGFWQAIEEIWPMTRGSALLGPLCRAPDYPDQRRQTGLGGRMRHNPCDLMIGTGSSFLPGNATAARRHRHLGDRALAWTRKRRDHPGLPACRSGDQGARIG